MNEAPSANVGAPRPSHRRCRGSRGLGRDRDARVDQLDEGAVLHRIESSKLNDPILIGAHACCLCVVKNRSHTVKNCIYPDKLLSIWDEKTFFTPICMPRDIAQHRAAAGLFFP